MHFYISARSIWSDHKIECFIFLISLIFYSTFSSRSIIHGDTGEFLAIASVHGVPHDPGFPLYSMILSFVFFLTKNAWVVNMTSSLFAAITLVLIFMSVKAIIKHSMIALSCVFLLGLYNCFWFYALTAQIHAIYIFVQSLLFFLLVKSIQTRKQIFLYLSAYVFGLGVATHQVIILLVPGFFLTLFYLHSMLSIKKLILLGLLSLCGLLPYLYIFWASSTHPAINWGNVHDLSSFFYLFFRKDYGVVLLSKPEAAAPFIYYPFLNYFSQLTITSWYAFPFVIYSFSYLFQKNHIYILTFICYILTGPFYYFLVTIPIRSVGYRGTIEQYFAYSFFFFCILAAYGLQKFLTHIAQKNQRYIFFILFICLLISFFQTLPTVRLDNNTFVEKTTKMQLSQIPRNGILLTWSDSLYIPTLYWQYVEKYRPDIKVLQLGLINLSWYRDHIDRTNPEFSAYIKNGVFDYEKVCKQLAAENNLFIYPWFSDYNQAFGKDCQIIPYGLINKVVTTKNIPPIETIKQYNDTIWDTYDKTIDATQYKNSFVRTREGLYYIAEQKNFTGLYYMQQNKTSWAITDFKTAENFSLDEVNALTNQSVIAYTKGNYTDAISLLEKGLEKNPAEQNIYKNIGFSYGKRGDEQKAYENLKIYVSFNPQDKDIPVIQTFLSQYEAKQKNTVQ